MDNQDRQIHPFRVAYRNEDKFHAIIKKFVRRATKLGVTAPEVVKFERVEKIHTREDVTGQRYSEVEVYFDAEVACQPVKLAGWSFLATLSHEEGGTVLRVIPGATVPESYREAKQVCDHCGTNRRRRETFLVQHEDGTLKQVGRQCIADFLGADPARALWVTEFIHDLHASEEGDDFGGGGSATHFEFTEYLSWVAKTIREDGFVSRAAAKAYAEKAGENGGRISASADAASGLRNTKLYGPKDEARKIEWPTEADVAEAAKAIEWARDGLKTPGKVLTDYEHNLVVIANSTVLQPKNFGIAASIIPAFQRVEGRLKRRESQHRADADCVHFGTVGKRQVFKLTVESHRSFESDFGARHLYRLRDEEGNIAVWWTANPPAFEQTPENRTFYVKATVKAHGDYNGIKQTTLSRATFEGEAEALSTTSGLL